MRRRGPEEGACGVWLDAAALKRRKVQTHLMMPNTKMLTLFPGEKKAKISFTQRIPPAGLQQTSIASFFTLQPGRTIGGDQRNVSSPLESQTNEESKNESLHDCGHHRKGTPFSTMLSLLQPDTLVYAGKSKASPSSSFANNLEGSCSLDPKEKDKDSSWEREWLHGSKKKNYQGVQRRIKPARGKGLQPLDKTQLEKVSAKETRPILLHTYRDSWDGENKDSAKHSPCPVPVLSCDSEKNDKDSWSQLFTEDSQGWRVIAHNSRAPFRDVTNNQNRDLGQFPSSPWAQCQEMPTQFSLQPDLLFTQDSEGNQVIRHQV
ncbi:aurora kinase A and ninein-interacting protein isoform X4 [Suricata suricatta]|uniref:aurora kinase A and ninein-interacting protein isoform X4 n=1 Tax=Suricata suricatta TaxID=37032 RepID=UPI0011553183|nr:aurora kinase A and ninein-interacting protein isoform X4 [Suricata suricatta]